MIPSVFITEWAKDLPWQNPWQVEQDLIISKALLDIYAEPELNANLSFRGGTALNKLFLQPASRYSEDIDLVQVTEKPIGETLELLRQVLDPWLGNPKRNFSDARVTLVYRVLSESGVPLKLKVEINSREHFAVLGFKEVSFSVKSSWQSGEVVIKTYALEEMLGSKLRALYQRRKGRDLYDLYVSLKKFQDLDATLIIKCFVKYMDFVGAKVSRKEFEQNVLLKLENEDFKKDIFPLFPSQTEKYDVFEAYDLVQAKLISMMD